MKEYPIPFLDLMVRAILDGRKTQTRRPLRVQPDPEFAFNWRRWVISDQYGNEPQYEGNRPLWVCGPADGMCEQFACRYGEPGDRLWVREKLVRCQDSENSIPLALYDVLRTPVMRYGEPARWEWKVSALSGRYMPRWASRITLEIVNVRVERIQDIARDDIEAEGTPGNPMQQLSYRNDFFQRRRDFAWLWDSINAKRGYGWDLNPWVWCITFKRLEHETPLIAQ